MNRDDGPRPGTQRSVAELLAAYGAESRPPSRRRVAASAYRDPPGVAPTDLGEDAGRPTGGGDAGGYDTVGYDDRHVSAPDHGLAPGGHGGTGHGPYPPSRNIWAPARPAEPLGPPPGFPGPPATGAQAFGAPPARSSVPNPPTLGVSATPAGVPAARTGGPVTAASPFASSPVAGPDLTEDDLDDARDDAPAGLGPTPQRARPDRGNDREDEFENDPEDDLDEEPEERSSSVKDWAVMIVQLVLGALLGAVLWTVFSYLWQEQPVVALVLAAAATTGLVFGVRALRRSDDLQTTVLAVVVGLVVTVSPAAIVLLSR